MHDAGILSRPLRPVIKNRLYREIGEKGKRGIGKRGTDKRGRRETKSLNSRSLFPYSPLPLFPFLSVVGINDAGGETAAVISVVVVVDQQIKSSIDRCGKCCLAADQEDLRRLAVCLKYVTDESAHSRGRYRTPVGAKDRAGTQASAIRRYDSNPLSCCDIS